jgi:hypothetical protein
MSKRTKIVKTPTLDAGLAHTKKMVRDSYVVRIKRPSTMTHVECENKIRNAVFDCFNEAQEINVERFM